MYSLGWVLYQMLTGAVPYPKESVLKTLLAHAQEQPPKPSAVTLGLSMFDRSVNTLACPQ